MYIATHDTEHFMYHILQAVSLKVIYHVILSIPAVSFTLCCI
jgi:hypothetical protein